MKPFDNMRAKNRLNGAFAVLDVYSCEVQGGPYDTPEVRDGVLGMVDRVVKTTDSARVLASQQNLAARQERTGGLRTRDGMIAQWNGLMDDLNQEVIADRLDRIDPLTQHDLNNDTERSR